MLSKQTLDTASRDFRSALVMTLPQLELLLTCSQRSVQRYLQRWGCLNSFNHNGAFYALPDVPVFDPTGIWLYKGIGFSRFGNLKETVICLIENSADGLTAAELSRVLSMNSHSFLSQFRSEPRLQREKWEGSWVYFAAKPGVCEQQRLRRAGELPPVSISLPSDAQAVIILVCIIKNPDMAIEALVEEVQKQHSGIELGMIEGFLEHHDIKKKRPGICTTTPG